MQLNHVSFKMIGYESFRTQSAPVRFFSRMQSLVHFQVPGEKNWKCFCHSQSIHKIWVFHVSSYAPRDFLYFQNLYHTCCTNMVCCQYEHVHALQEACDCWILCHKCCNNIEVSSMFAVCSCVALILAKLRNHLHIGHKWNPFLHYVVFHVHFKDVSKRNFLGIKNRRID